MSFIVTARKWRPSRFEDVIGQEHITTTLKNAVKNNRIAHAFLFAGPRGVGKTTTARILAKMLNCTNPREFEPCNECEMCKSFNSSQSLDIIEIDGASNRRIEEIRTLRESVKYAPTKGVYKVYIIDEVHMLTTESFNALLKTLEEPPEHTIFIFATTDVHKVPLTIISRCQRFDFRRIEMTAIKQLLQKIADNENIEIDDRSLTIIAKKADGALRDAESIFDQMVSFGGNKVEAETVSRMLNLIDDEVYFLLTDAILSKSFITAFDVTKKLYDNGWNFLDFLNGLIEHFRNIMTVVLTGNTTLIEAAEIYKERYLKYKTEFSEADLLRILNFLNKIMQEMRYAQNQRIKIEIALCHMIGLEKSATITALINNLEKIDFGSQAAVNASAPASYADSAPAQISSPAPPPENAETVAVTKDPEAITVSDAAQADLADIQAKWSEFVNAVAQEKFFAGSALRSIRVTGLDANKLEVETNDASMKGLIQQNEEYFYQKTEKVFGKNLRFVFKNTAGASVHSASADTDQSKNASKSAGETNPVIKAVIDELGGEEIR